jgi:hypothetical protein
VAVVGWSWSPAHSRFDYLYLSLDRSRHWWLLWLEWHDEEKESRVFAYMPRQDTGESDAARRLVICAYTGERMEYDGPEDPFQEVVATGLLTAADLKAVARTVWAPRGAGSC